MNTLSFSSVASLPSLPMSSTLQGAGSGQAAAMPGQDFASVLRSFATDAANTVRQGEAAAIAGVQGQIPLQELVQHVTAAERSLQTALAVRDKAVGAYLEISRMQI